MAEQTGEPGVRLGLVHGAEQFGEVTLVVVIQPFRLAVIVMLVPTGILLMVLPLTVPAVEVIVPLVVTFTE
ncbi:hypothetical protein GCM10028808_27240 [Spirosoma migulaei]